MPSETPGPVSSGAVIARAARQNKLGIAVATVVVLRLLAAAGIGIRSLLTRSHPLPFASSTVTRVPGTSGAVAVGLSPDAKYVATIRRDESGHGSLWLRHLATNSNTQIAAAAKGEDFSCVLFSPNGEYIYFCHTTLENNATLDNLYRVPVPTETMNVLMKSDWPGNVSQLESFIERAVILTEGSTLQAALAEL